MKLRHSALLTSAIVAGTCALAPVAALAAGTAAAPLAAANIAADAPTGGVPVPATGAYAGAAVNVQDGQTWQQAFTNFESQSGRDLAVHRMYQDWDAPAVSNLTRWDSLNGIIPALSIQSPKWAEVASGAHDAVIVNQAQAFKALGTPVLLTFNHEPEFDPTLGSPSDYQAAWRHWVSVYRQQGVTNVSFDFVMLGNSYGRGGAVANSFYPGDDYVDWLGVDGYNWFNNNGSDWLSFDQVFTGFRTWAVNHPKPLFIAEVGTDEDTDPARKAAWVRDMGQSLKTWPEVKAVSWFNWYPPADSPTDSHFRLTTSPQAIAAWKQVVADPYLAPMLATVSQGTPQQIDAPVVSAGPLTVSPGVKPTVTGTVTTPGATATVHVEYGPTDSYGTSTADIVVPASADPVAFTATLPALTPLATYHYRVVSLNAGGTTSTPDAALQIPGKPTATTAPASQAFGTTAVVSGTATANGVPTTATFVFGPSQSYGRSTAPVSLPAGWTAQSLSTTLTGLNPGWTYHVRLRTTNAYGTGQGPDIVFKAAPGPKVDTWVAGTRTASSITARGSVVPGTLSTTYSFQYGTTTAYGMTTKTITLPPGSSPVAVQALITGLPKATAHHYRIIATNQAGTSYGPDKTSVTAKV